MKEIHNAKMGQESQVKLGVLIPNPMLDSPFDGIHVRKEKRVCVCIGSTETNQPLNDPTF